MNRHYIRASLRTSFALNDLEQDVIKSIRDRNHKCYAIALLGYFKIKPILLKPSYKALKEDLTFIAEEYFLKFKVPRFSVARMQKARIYDRILNLADLVDDKNTLTVKELKRAAKSVTAPELQKRVER